MSNTTMTLGGWLFDMGTPLVPGMLLILFGSLIFTLVTVRRRLFGRNRPRALLVMALNILAFAVVMLLVAEPRREHLLEQSVVLITEGADVDGGIMADNSKIYVAPGLANSEQQLPALKHANWLLDTGQLTLREPALSTVKINGYGLRSDQWQSLPGDLVLNFNPPTVNGFTEMRWPRQLLSGETLAVSGRFNSGQSDSIIQLRLLDPAGSKIDEVRILNGGMFNLLARPKSNGLLAYKIQAWEGETLQSEETIRASVGTASPVSIMVYQSAPSYETLQLKNFAAAQGARVLIHTRISRGKSISQSVNLAENAETGYSPQTLSEQDVLIIDGRTLTDMDDLQMQWLQVAVEQGLGVLILADTSLVESFADFSTGMLRGFSLEHDADAKPIAIPYLPNNIPIAADLPMPVAAMRLQNAQAGTETLVHDGHRRVIIAQHRQGLGKVAVSLISRSHSWFTSGHRSAWSDYWSGLIAAVGRPRTDSFLIPPADTAFHSRARKTPVCALSSKGSLTVLITPPGNEHGEVPFELPLVPGELGSARHCAWFWPQSGGWHQVQLRAAGDGEILDRQALHITEADEWLAQKRHERVTETFSRIADTDTTPTRPGGGKLVSEPLNKTWLWCLLVLSASLLWLERKLDFDA
jgi:hypothetical protein